MKNGSYTLVIIVFFVLILNVSVFCCAEEEVNSCNSSSGVPWRLETLPSAPSGVAFVNEAATLDIALENHTVSDQHVRLTVATTTDLGQRSSEIIEINAPGCGTANVSVQLPTNENGYQLLEIFLEVDGQVVAEATTALAVVNQPANYGGVDPESHFGLCEVTDYEAAQRMGCKYARGGLAWVYNEQVQGEYINMPTAARLDALQADYGIRMMYTVGFYPPAWAADATHPSVPDPAYYSNWQAYLQELVSRLDGKIDIIDIHNEPDQTLIANEGMLTSQAGQVYADLLNYAYDGVKAADPNCDVGGLAVGTDLPHYSFTTAVLAAGGRLDIMTGHPYVNAHAGRRFGPGQTPTMPGQWLTDACENALNMMQSHGLPCRYLVGEQGWALDPSTGELSSYAEDFAGCTAQAMITTMAVPGVEKHLYFMQRPFTEAGYQYSLFRGDEDGDPMYPLPGVCSYATCAYMLHHGSIVGELTLDANTKGYRFNRDDGMSVCVFWSKSAQQNLTVSIVSSSYTYNSFGREIDSGSALDITFDSMPVYIVVPQADGATLASQLEAAF